MSLISHLQSLGATHLFTLSNEGTNVSHDYGDSVDPTHITGGTYSFVTNPVCYGVTHCLRSTNSGSTSVDGAILDNRNDINSRNGAGNDSSSFNYSSGVRSIMLWSRQLNIWNPTCIYEQGGGTNNFAFMGGAQRTFQAADQGQPFLVTAGKTIASVNRNILMVGVWEYQTQHAGSGNRILYYENGILQEIVELSGTATFPAHSGDITIGNSSESLKSFNDTTLISQTVSKDANVLGLFNNIALTESQCRDVYERTVLPEILVEGTVSEQQAILDTHANSTWQDVNCVFEIRQATDATDYTLSIDNINFIQNPNLGDIAIKYVGTNNLTVVNTNGSNAEITTAPPEQDLDGTVVLAGGGNIIIETPVTFNLIGINPNTKVYLFDSDLPRIDPGYVLDSSLVVSGVYTFTYNHSIDINVTVRIVELGANYIEFNTTLTDTNATIPINQQIDRNYNND